MTTVVQTGYRPFIAPGLVGMPADGTPHSDMSRTVETAGGIGFGLAVSQGTQDLGCILGGSSFVGVTVRDITVNQVSIDPLNTTRPAVDVYPQWDTAAVRTRGNIWVLAGSDVAAGAGLFYDTTAGLFSSSASGLAATGNITFTTNPVAGQTLVINGTTVTWEASGATGNQANIGASLGDSLANLVAVLNASADTGLVALKYALDPPNSPVSGGNLGSGGNRILIADKTVGTGGNALTITAGTTTGATASGATLTGGTASATSIPGGFWRTTAVAGQLAVISLGYQH
jgi:hypothetical protein